MANVDHKIKLLILYDILSKTTDEEHQLNTDEIIVLLKEKGIEVSRKICERISRRSIIMGMRF